MSTWAKLAANSQEGAPDAVAADKPAAVEQPSASTSSKTSTTTLPPGAAQRRQSTSKPKSNGPSKASTSDNWRASAKANTETSAQPARSSDQRASTAKAKADSSATTDDDGWEKVTKKEKAAPVSTQPRGKKQAKEGGGKKGEARRAGHESSGAEDKGRKGAASTTKGTTAVNGAPTKKDAPSTAVRPSLKPAQSWADDDGSGRLPSPNFGATASPAAVPVAAPLGADDHAVENLALPPSATGSRTDSPPTPNPDSSSSNPAVEITPSDNQPSAAAAAEAKPAVPKVNVWSVRKEQLAQAAPATAGTEGKEQKAPAPTAAKEKKEEPSKSSKKDEARRSQQPKKSTAANEAATSSKAKAPARQGGSSAGWSSTSTSVKQKGPVVVAGEDATSWPAPVEAVKELDEAAKAKQDQESKPKASKTSGAQQKKKKGAIRRACQDQRSRKLTFWHEIQAKRSGSRSRPRSRSRRRVPSPEARGQRQPRPRPARRRRAVRRLIRHRRESRPLQHRSTLCPPSRQRLLLPPPRQRPLRPPSNRLPPLLRQELRHHRPSLRRFRRPVGICLSLRPLQTQLPSRQLRLQLRRLAARKAPRLQRLLRPNRHLPLAKVTLIVTVIRPRSLDADAEDVEVLRREAHAAAAEEEEPCLPTTRIGSSNSSSRLRCKLSATCPFPPISTHRAPASSMRTVTPCPYRSSTRQQVRSRSTRACSTRHGTGSSARSSGGSRSTISAATSSSGNL